MQTNRVVQHNANLRIPTAAGNIANVLDRDIWVDTTNSALAVRIGGATVLLTQGLTTEQIQDIVGPFIADSADLDFTYDDAGNAVAALLKSNVVTYAKMQDISASSRILGRITAGSGDPEELTAANVKTILALASTDLSDFTEAVQDILGAISVDSAEMDWTYDDVGNGLTLVLLNGSVANAKLANMAAATFKGRALGAGTGVPTDLTAAQAKTALAIVPADTAFSTTSRVLGRITAGAGAGEELTGANIRTILGTLDADTVNGLSAATIQTNTLNAIVAGAGAAWDTLLEIKAFIQADESTAAALATTVAGKARFQAGVVPNGASPQTITHGLALTNRDDFMIKITDTATHKEVEYECVSADVNSITVTDEMGTAIPAGLRYFLTAST